MPLREKLKSRGEARQWLALGRRIIDACDKFFVGAMPDWESECLFADKQIKTIGTAIKAARIAEALSSTTAPQLLAFYVIA